MNVALFAILSKLGNKQLASLTADEIGEIGGALGVPVKPVMVKALTAMLSPVGHVTVLGVLADQVVAQRVKLAFSLLNQHGDKPLRELPSTAIAEAAGLFGLSLDEGSADELAVVLASDDVDSLADYLGEPERFKALMAHTFANRKSAELMVRCPHCTDLFVVPGVADVMRCPHCTEFLSTE